MASVKTNANQFTWYGDSQMEFRSSLLTSKMQLLGSREFAVTADQLSQSSSRKPAGIPYHHFFCILFLNLNSFLSSIYIWFYYIVTL